MKKTLQSIIAGVSLLVGASATQLDAKNVNSFNSQVIDTNVVNRIPVSRIDKRTDKAQHIFYSKPNEIVNDMLFYTADRLENFGTIFSLKQMFLDGRLQLDEITNQKNPSFALGPEHGIFHLAFNADWHDSPRTFYASNWYPNRFLDLWIPNEGQRPFVDVNDNNNLTISSVIKWSTSADYDVIVMRKNNGDTYIENPYDFDSRVEIAKPGDQFNPIARTDLSGVTHVIYGDTSDGTFKLRYRNSSDNYTLEETISDAEYAYDADMQLDSNGNVYVAFKDTTYSGVKDREHGDVFITDRNSGWSKTRVTSAPKLFGLDRPVSLALDDYNRPHLAWTEIDAGTMEILYAGLPNGFRNIWVDNSDIDKGYVHLTTKDNKPIIVGNSHSLVNYTPNFDDIVPEPSSVGLIGIGAGLVYLGLRRNEK